LQNYQKNNWKNGVKWKVETFAKSLFFK